MRLLRRFLRRLSTLATGDDGQERLSAEIEDHLAQQTAEYVRAGMTPDEARRLAVLKFGGVSAAKEAWRDERRLPAVDSLLQDTRYAWRRLRAAPAFTIATVLTLALGIGATTAIFTLVHAVLLKSLPVRDPADLVRVGLRARCCYWGGFSQDREFSLFSYSLYRHLRDGSANAIDLAGFSAGQGPVGVVRTGNARQAHSAPAEYVSGNYFTMFGIRPYVGRVLTPGDDRPGAPAVAVMSYRLWIDQYGGDPAVVGGGFNLNERPFTVVGIAPPGFFGDTLRDAPPDFFLPLNTEPLLNSDSALGHEDTHWLAVIGRLRPGAASGAVEAHMRVDLTSWLRAHSDAMSSNDRAKLPSQTLFLRPGGAGITSMREQYQHWLGILMGVTGCALLIVCANVATLMLVRGMARRRQTSLSIALGARPARVIRAPLIESLLLASAGGAAGLAVAFVGTRLILQVVFPALPGAGGVPIEAAPSMPVLLFAVAVSVITGIAFGTVPAWMATRVDPIEVLRSGGRSTVRGASLPRAALVVFQAVLTLMLLSAAGLLTSVLRGLEHQDFGFEPDHRIVAQIGPRLVGYQPDQLTPLYERIHDAVGRVPGVRGVALAMYSPFGNNHSGTGVLVDGHPSPGPNDDAYSAWDRVTAGYFDAIGNAVVRGRGIERQDTGTSRHVAVVNEAFVRKFFRNEDPLGRRFGQHGVGSEREYEIVGVVRDSRYFTFDLDKPVHPFFFLPESQHDTSLTAPSTDANPGSHFLHDVVIAVHPGMNVSSATIREAIAAADSRLPVTSIHTLQEQVSRAFTDQRLIARLTSFFGVLSLILASIGLYGVTAYNAGQRTGEIGVRIALGATPGLVVRLVLRGTVWLILIALVIGLPLTFGVGRMLGAQLYGANPFNLTVALTAVATLLLSAFVASIVPALRASAISPVNALRAE